LGGPPGFLGYATKTQFWVTKWGGMLYEVIIQYWGEKGKDGEDGYTGWYFQEVGIE